MTREQPILLRDIRDAVNFTGEKCDILNEDLEKIARIFLGYFLDDDQEKVSQQDFKSLREKYIDRFKMESILPTPVSEKEFYDHICKHFLFIQTNNNRQKLYDVVNKIILDLREIKHDREQYQTELKKIKGKEFEDGDNYEEKLISHYIKKQDSAEKQIVEFIITSLHSYTSKNGYVSIFDGIGSGTDLRYSYNWDKRSYKKEHLSEVVNKLLHVSVIRYYELEKIYRTDKNKFIKEVEKDVKVESVIENIKYRVNSNHLLNTRKPLVSDLLNLFKRKKYELFCNVCPQLIEGLLYDYCLESGIKESALVNSTLVEKINYLNDNYDHNIKISYEYFAFKFPIIRNRIAHGKKVKEDLYLLSWILLMDLNYVCDLFKSGHLITNKKIGLIENAFKDSKLSNLILLSSVFIDPLPVFYTKEIKKFEKLKDKIKTDLTSDNFSQSVTLGKEDEKQILIDCIKDLKKVGINDQECAKILKLIK
ncbi:MAG: hypothetical protein KF803_14440 [Cyclobacteriaceae bacterium]|nr:hypothetical protein [Cyclobacteriaceae bacterium]